MARFMALDAGQTAWRSWCRACWRNKLLAWPIGRPHPEAMRDEALPAAPAACLVKVGFSKEGSFLTS